MDKPPEVRFAGVSLDCADPDELAAFYIGLLGGRLLRRDEDSAGVQVPGLLMVMQRVADYRKPVWPGASIVHLDLTAGDSLAEAEQRALALGATAAEHQPDERWRVLLDPAGHPFCITTVAPPPEVLRSTFGF
ncbi:VOC family protein [Saccharopolyspora taberi]|uniref:VOC family protein n=1 Tax=Saccharopolyspora taberi TaxID=60895 RepID=A0ABN3VDN4_9PSEU